MPLKEESGPVTPDLSGSPRNPAREPVKGKPKDGKGSPGDMAFMDAVCIVGAAWVILLMLAYSLRNHNV